MAFSRLDELGLLAQVEATQALKAGDDLVKYLKDSCRRVQKKDLTLDAMIVID